MIEQKNIQEPEKVSCEVCFKEIPLSEATSVKATDYIVYYCGLECYDRWKQQQAESGLQKVLRCTDSLLAQGILRETRSLPVLDKVLFQFIALHSICRQINNTFLNRGFRSCEFFSSSL